MKKSPLLLLMLLLCLSGLQVAQAQGPDNLTKPTYLYYFGPAAGGIHNGVSQLVVKSSGNLLVADGSKEISEFTPYGELVKTYTKDAGGNALPSVSQMLIDASDNVYILGFGSGNGPSISIYDDTWKRTSSIALDKTIPGAALIALDSANKLIYALSYSDEKPDANGQTTLLVAIDDTGNIGKPVKLKLPAGPGGGAAFGNLLVTSDGNILVASGGVSLSNVNYSGGIVVFRPDGTLVSKSPTDSFGVPQLHPGGVMMTSTYFAVPHGYILDKEGRAYAFETYLDGGNRNFLTITDPSGKQLYRMPVSKSDRPGNACVAFSPDGKILYVNTSNFIHFVSLTDDPPYNTALVITNTGVYSQADKKSKSLGTAYKGSPLIVNGKNDAGDWLEVHFKGAAAWVPATSWGNQRVTYSARLTDEASIVGTIVAGSLL